MKREVGGEAAFKDGSEGFEDKENSPGEQKAPERYGRAGRLVQYWVTGSIYFEDDQIKPDASFPEPHSS